MKQNSNKLNFTISMIFLIAISSCTERQSEVPDFCEELKRLALHELDKGNLILWVEEINNNPSKIAHLNTDIGPIRLSTDELAERVDWPLIGAGYPITSVEFYGKDIDYKNLKYNGIEAFSVNLGKRVSLYIELIDNPKYGYDISQFESHVQVFDENTFLICR